MSYILSYVCQLVQQRIAIQFKLNQLTHLSTTCAHLHVMDSLSWESDVISARLRACLMQLHLYLDQYTLLTFNCSWGAAQTHKSSQESIQKMNKNAHSR